MPVDIAYAIFLAKSFAIAAFGALVLVAFLVTLDAREERRRKEREGR